MSDHRGGVWGAREDAVWWPGAIAADQQTLHQQFMQQQQLAVQQQQQQVAQHQAIQQQNDAAAAHQLFSYKMASTFQHPTTTQSSNQMPDMRYDYRIAGNSGSPQQSAPQWWYSNTMDNSMQNSLVNQSNMQNMSPVHTPPPAVTQQSQVQSSIQQQQVEAQVRQQQHQQAVEVHRQQEVQRHQAEAQAARQQAEAQVARQQAEVQRHQNHHQSHQNNQHTQTVHQNNQQQQRLLAAEQEQQKAIQNLITPIHVPTRGRMPRGKSDPRPRGRMTAYAFFVQTCREEHKKKHPEENVVFAEFSKKCAERWKTMLDKEKKRFHEMAEKDKKRYDAEMQNYTPPKGEKPRGKKRKQVKDPNAPKRSLSAFFWFCNDERGKVKGQNPEYGVGDIAKELGRRWADADPESKSRYESLAEKDKARYEKEMTAYKKKSNPALQPAVPVLAADDDDDEEDIDDDDDE